MDPAFLQFGALGIVAVVVIRLVTWLTNALNGKLDRLTEGLKENTTATRELARALENHLTRGAG